MLGRCELQVLMYLVDLDSLNIQHSLESFTQCNKHALVKAVWQKHSHKKVVSSSLKFLQGGVIRLHS